MAGVEDSGLGKATRYDSNYDPSLLFPISRAENRASLPAAGQGFIGEDWWTCYELSWLQPGGLPGVALAHFRVPASSEFLIESKSFKLYLNSLNQLQIESAEALQVLLEKDLSKAAGAPVSVQIEGLSDSDYQTSPAIPGAVCLDDTPCDDRSFVYQPDAKLLQSDSSTIVHQYLYSDLLRSNCPVTGQPDWGSVFIEYKGPEIDPQSLLRYVVSFRQCQDFHEHCVERIFCDLMAQCQCQSLSVYARYTRRGGLDINPYRATPDMPAQAPFVRMIRQ